MTYDDLTKQRGTPEHRQAKLAANTEARERWMKKLFRAVLELRKLEAERKRLLNPRKDSKSRKDLDWTPDKYIGSGGGDPDLNDSVEDI